METRDTGDISTPIHRSLNRPQLILGGERTLVLMLGVIAGVFVFSLAHWWAALIGVALWSAGTWGLSRAALFDPQLSKTARRSIQYRHYYPARATPFTRIREVK